MSITSVKIPLNRVEGDLEVRVEITDDVVSDAWCSGTLYRGFERILVGRGSMDGLVITPRICGICSTSHLVAAAGALDVITGKQAPPDAVRLRNVAQMVEHVQSDVRHGMLMFAVDFVNPAYRDQPLYEEAVRRYAPFAGSAILETIRETKKVLEIVAILGGQWPHSAFMVPGGIVSVPSSGDLLQCGLILRHYREWFERSILGCSVDRWAEVRSARDLEAWLEENQAHKESELGFFLRYAKSIGLESVGKGNGNYISFGSLDLPEGSGVRASGGSTLVPAGFAHGSKTDGFDQSRIAEHVASSWFVDYDGGKHPFRGETNPYATGKESRKYSWAKAPRYDGLPTETGPLAEAVIAGSPLITDLIGQQGPSAYVRELARLIRPASLLPVMATWLTETTGEGSYYNRPDDIQDGEGFGSTEASRGALGHWVRIENGLIAHYQIITPSAWNFSPRDSQGQCGPVEQALIGTPVKDPENPVEVGHVVRSFDACLVCSVHTVRR